MAGTCKSWKHDLLRVDEAGRDGGLGITCGEEEKCCHSREHSTWIAQLCYIWWETVYLG